MTWQTSRNNGARGDFDIDHGPAGFSSLHDDPDSIVFGRFHSSSRNNYSFTKDPERDKLLEGAGERAEPEKRRGILGAIARFIADQVNSSGPALPAEVGLLAPLREELQAQLRLQSRLRDGVAGQVGS